MEVTYLPHLGFETRDSVCATNVGKSTFSNYYLERARNYTPVRNWFSSNGAQKISLDFLARPVTYAQYSGIWKVGTVYQYYAVVAINPGLTSITVQPQSTELIGNFSIQIAKNTDNRENVNPVWPFPFTVIRCAMLLYVYLLRHFLDCSLSFFLDFFSMAIFIDVPALISYFICDLYYF